MEFKKVDCESDEFIEMCHKLEDFQYDLMPELMAQGYCLTESLDEIEGFFLYDNGKLVGSIGLKEISDESCEIVRVFVNEEFRGQCYSKVLFEKIEDYAKSKGYKKAEMVAWTKAVAAVNLYKKLGYLCSEPKFSEWFGYEYVEFEKIL